MDRMDIHSWISEMSTEWWTEATPSELPDAGQGVSSAKTYDGLQVHEFRSKWRRALFTGSKKAR